MTIAAAVLSAVLFLAAWRLSGIYPHLLRVFSLSIEAARAMTDASLDDDEKERLARQYAFKMLRRFVEVTLRAVAVLALPAAALLILDALNLVEFREVAEILAMWEVILGSTAAAMIVWFIRRVARRTGSEEQSRE